MMRMRVYFAVKEAFARSCGGGDAGWASGLGGLGGKVGQHRGFVEKIMAQLHAGVVGGGGGRTGGGVSRGIGSEVHSRVGSEVGGGTCPDQHRHQFVKALD